MTQKRWMKSVIAAAQEATREATPDATQAPRLPWTRQARRAAKPVTAPRRAARSA